MRDESCTAEVKRMEETNNTSAYSDIFKHIEEIRNAKEQGKLVIFVGAGVSANSGLPSWEGLIKDFAEKLGYDVRKDSDAKEHFCSDEYLKIPQYSYNKNQDEYLQLLEAHFGADAINDKKPNLIHELIFKFSPAHIITTNYDPLIEKCDSSNRGYYTVVSSDKELLERGKSAKRLILKMHGDYKDLENIVLKEDDYLRYEQKRALTSTFIKSLLVNHTFLFIGYSINDYNFKQIIDWIEYLSEQVKAERDKMPTHFVIKTGSSHIQEYDKKYLKQKRIELLNANDLPESYIEESNAETLLTLADAKQLYAAMNAVVDPVADISILGSTETLLKRLRVFDDFKYIPYSSLIKALNLDDAYSEQVVLENKNDETEKDILLGWHRLRLSKTSEALFSLLKQACDAKKEINDFFLNAYFFDMYIPGGFPKVHDDSYKFSPSLSVGDEATDETDDLFLLYLNNEYPTLLKQANDSSCQRTKAYYNMLCFRRARIGDDIAENLKSLAYSTEQQSAFMRLLDKMNWFLFTCSLSIRHSMPDEFKKARQAVIEYFESLAESEQNAFAYIYDWIINSNSSQLTLECSEQLEKQESFYSNPGVSKTNPYDEVNKIAGKALCLYNFIKLNHVILDNFSDVKRLLWVFARAVLITYKPQDNASANDIFAFTTAAETTPVRIDEFTLDIIVKYSQYKLLREYIIKHRLSGFRFSSNNNAVRKLANLCASKELLAFGDFDEYFKNFCTLLRRCELSEEDEAQILNAIDNFQSDFLKPLFKDALNNGHQREFIKELLLLLANFKHKQVYVCETICGYIALVQDDKKASMAKFLVDNIYDNSFQLLKDKMLGLVAENEGFFAPYDKLVLMVNEFFKISENDISNIKSEVINISQKQSNVLQMSPDYDKAYIELCLVLVLLGKIEDISFLEAAREKYPFLNCVLQPESFDISAIDFKTSLWRKFFENDEYREKLLSVNDNRERIKESLVRTLNNGNAGHGENQVFYRHFWR